MIKNTKINYYIICIIFVLGTSNILFADGKTTFPDYISKKILKETKNENDRNVQIALRFSNVLGKRLNNVLNPDDIEKIFIPYKININPEQISYLFQHAIFRKKEELPPWHLGPIGTFQIVLKNYSVLAFHMYAGAPMIRVTVETDEHWLEIPDHKIFYALGKEKETRK